MRLIPPEDADMREVEKAPMLLTWGGDLGSGQYTGHNGEYLLHLPCLEKRGEPIEIPTSMSFILGQALGDEWSVSNRGSRLEISHVPLGLSDHELIMAATTRFLGQTVLPKLDSGS